jgi:hypothetical protein
MFIDGGAALRLEKNEEMAAAPGLPPSVGAAAAAVVWVEVGTAAAVVGAAVGLSKEEVEGGK